MITICINTLRNRDLRQRVVRPLLALAALAMGLVPAAETWMTLGDRGRAPASVHGVKGIAAGDNTVVVVRHDGTVIAWGDNHYGQTQVPTGLRDVVAVAAGSENSLALTADGRVVAWGNSRNRPPTDLRGVAAIAANGSNFLALQSNGAVIAWGESATTIPTGLSGVVAIAAGSYHAVAIKNDGTVVAWGDNTFGQATVPAGLNGVVAVSAGRRHTVALKSDGTVVAWGDNIVGQVTVPADLSDVVAISSLALTTLALKRNGTLVGWGDNTYGQTTQAMTLTGVAAAASGVYHGVALGTNGTVTAIGSMRTIDLNAVSQIASGSEDFFAARTATGEVIVWGQASPRLAAVPAGLSTAVQTTVSFDAVQVLKANGTVTAWGMGSGATVPTGLSGVIALAAGRSHILALKSNGSVTAWGNNTSGETATNGLSDIRAIAAGEALSLAVHTDGTVTALGDNTYGRATVPTGLTDVVSVAAGKRHALALKRDGTVIGWGDDAAHQATPPNGLTNVVAIAAGNYHSLALRQDGTVAAWGRTDKEMLSIPASVTGVTAIAAGGYTSWLRLPARPANAVTIASRAELYDGTPKSLSVTTANGRRPTRVTYNGSDTLPSATGTYLVVAEADYLDSYGSATASLSIASSTQAVTFPAATGLIYGADPITFATNSSADLPISYSVVSGPGTMSGTILTITGAGTIRVQADQAGNATYAAVQMTQDIQVAKATLTVTANNQGRPAGAANPTLTATISGYVNGEDASAVTGSPVLSTTATTSSAAGIYPITVNVWGMSSPNYTFVGVNGSLVVSTSTPGDGSGAAGGGGGGGGCGIGSALGLLLAPLLAALHLWRRRERTR